VVESYASKFSCPVRYVFEPTPGLSHARNTALRHARGEILAWTDDDVLVDPDWLVAIYTSFSDRQVTCIGGKVLPLWAVPPPSWLSPKNYAAIVAIDWGDKPIVLQSDRIVGANFAVRVEMFKKYGPFRPDLGATPTSIGCSGEDLEFVSRLISGGEKVLYQPDMVVQHQVPKSRMTASYHLRRHYDEGKNNAMAMGQHPARSLLGVPYFVIRKDFMIPLGRFLASLFGPGDVRMHSLLRLASFLGFVKGRFSWLVRNYRKS
jgi:glucosyl-dolichyl phosphate glucuronosyltransferase